MVDETLDISSLNIEAHVARLQAISDPIARATATELVASVLQLHSAALERMLSIIDESAESDGLMIKLDADPLVRSILLLHDLHPDRTDKRVRRALQELEGRLKKRDASVELVSFDDRRLKLRLINNGASCGTETIVEDAIRNAAPEIGEIEVETITPLRSGFVSIESLGIAGVAPVAGVQE
jgi:hypothetical protein